MKTVEVFERKPECFCPRAEVVGCYLEKGGKALFLLNAADDSEPGKWGVPGGKLEVGEDLVRGVLRELFEETAIVLDAGAIVLVGSLYVRKPGWGDYVYHVFSARIEGEVEVRLSREHEAYRWVSREEVRSLPGMGGANEAWEWLLRRLG